MFDDCKRYRKLLEACHDNTIGVRDMTLLEAHVAVCSSCREAAAADSALFMVLAEEPCSTSVNPAPFDEQILDSLISSPPASRASWQLTVMQAIAGALAAAAVTALVLAPVLKSTSTVPIRTDARTKPVVSSAGVSLQRLLDAESPQAALLWTRPRTGSARVSPG